MARASSTFRQGDVTKALRAVGAAGLAVARVEIDQGGKIVIVTGSGERIESPNALDRWLAQYRDLWEKRLDRLEEALEKKRKRSKTPHQEQDT